MTTVKVYQDGVEMPAEIHEPQRVLVTEAKYPHLPAFLKRFKWFQVKRWIWTPGYVSLANPPAAGAVVNVRYEVDYD